MDFGYFTLSDNRYQNNTRTPEQFIKDIYKEQMAKFMELIAPAFAGEHRRA